MKLTDEQQVHLERLTVTAELVETAKWLRREATIAALDAHVPLQRVAQAAGIGRSGVYRLLEVEQDATNRRDSP